LVSRVVPHDEPMPAARELAGRIAQNAAHGLGLAKRLVREAMLPILILSWKCLPLFR
jgi:enoyl-CoA hydratase/carnithine racemase